MYIIDSHVDKENSKMMLIMLASIIHETQILPSSL